MERYLSGGIYRPSVIDRSNVRIQLPCSEKAFNQGKAVKTNQLAPEESKTVNGATGESHNMVTKGAAFGPSPSADNRDFIYHETVESPQCHYMRALEHFRDYIAWSALVG